MSLVDAIEMLASHPMGFRVWQDFKPVRSGGAEAIPGGEFHAMTNDLPVKYRYADSAESAIIALAEAVQEINDAIRARGNDGP